MFEPLKALLDAYEARLKPNQIMEKGYRSYPDPLEQKRLEVFQKMFEVTQAALERHATQVDQEPNSPVETKSNSVELERKTNEETKSSRNPRRRKSRKQKETEEASRETISPEKDPIVRKTNPKEREEKATIPDKTSKLAPEIPTGVRTEKEKNNTKEKETKTMC